MDTLKYLPASRGARDVFMTIRMNAFGHPKKGRAAGFEPIARRRIDAAETALT
jgi:hypothetical protein